MNFPIASGTVPEGSRANPEHAGPPDSKAGLTEPAQPDWITVNDAQEYFRQLGLPRSVEAIRKYCRQGKLAAEVIAGPKGDQHMIKRNSVDTFVSEQLKVLEAASRSIPVRDGTTRLIPVHSVSSRVEPEQPDREEGINSTAEVDKLKKKIERLETEKRDLEIDKEVRTRMNGILEENNNRLIEQVRVVSQEAQEWSRKFGQLEERVQHLRLASPSSSMDNSNTSKIGDSEDANDHLAERDVSNTSPVGYQHPTAGSVGV